MSEKLYPKSNLLYKYLCITGQCDSDKKKNTHVHNSINMLISMWKQSENVKFGKLKDQNETLMGF